MSGIKEIKMKNRGEPFKAFKGLAGMLGLAFLAYTCSKEYKANNLRSTTEAETDENTVTDPDSEGGKGSKAVTICQSHATEEEIAELWNKFWEQRGAKAVPRRPNRSGIDNCYRHDAYGAFSVKINPLGEWTGGPDVDCGATNRKLGSDMGDGVTGGGLHGKDLSKADVSVNIWCYLESIRTGHQVTACCSIGDESVNGIPYADIVEQARLYIHTLGGFERFAEWGLIRPLAQE